MTSFEKVYPFRLLVVFFVVIAARGVRFPLEHVCVSVLAHVHMEMR